MTPFIKLQMHIMSDDMVSVGTETVMNNLKSLPAFAHVAKVKIREYIEAARSAKDADPNWTDDEICQMILDGIDKQKEIYQIFLEGNS